MENTSMLKKLAVAVLMLAALPSQAARVKYYHLDALGSVRVVTDQAGAEVERHDYLPFGEECTTGPCATNPGLGGGEPKKFTGKERDSQTGLDYFGARYYAQKVGRFTTVDPVYNWNENLLDPQRWNRYTYVRNNPFRYVDPDGRDTTEVRLGLINALGSNFLLGAGRQTATSSDFAAGQFIGDLLSVPIGIAEGALGKGLAGGGLLAEAPSGTSSTVAVVTGGAMVVQGGTAGVSGAAHAGVYLAKSIVEMANDLAGRIGKNSVSFDTPTTKGRIDLKGKAHFDKATGQTIETPHVQTKPKHVGPNGQVNTGPGTTRPATKGDVRTAEKLAERQR